MDAIGYLTLLTFSTQDNRQETQVKTKKTASTPKTLIIFMIGRFINMCALAWKLKVEGG